MYLLSIILCVVVAFAPQFVKADVTNFTPSSYGWTEINGPVTIEFDQDGTACAGLATDYVLYLGTGGVGSGEIKYPIIATTTLIAEHISETISYADLQAVGISYGTYVNIVLQYSDTGNVCGDEIGVGFGEQNFGYADTASVSYTRTPDTALNGESYSPIQLFTIDFTVDPTPSKWPATALYYQLYSEDKCFPTTPVYTNYSYASAQLPFGYYDIKVRFSEDDAVDINGCFDGAVLFSYPETTTLDDFTVESEYEPIINQMIKDQFHNDIFHGVVVMFFGLLFWPIIFKKV